MSKHIDDAFDIQNNYIDVDENKRMVTRSEPPLIAVKEDESETDKEYDYARKNYINVIEAGSDALAEAIALAEASENPKSYEPVAALMKALLEANRDFVRLAKDKKELNEDGSEDSGKTPSKQINNNLFVGSTAEFQNMLKNLKES